MRVLIFGGTTEGRRLARALSAMGHQVWVSVATPLGAEELAGLEDVSVLVGRRSGGEMDALLSRGFHRCVDATHPYAVQATREIGAACAKNFATAVHDWFDRELSEFELHLMPLAFVDLPTNMDGFLLNAEEKNFLSFLEALDKPQADPDSPYSVTVNIELKFTRSKAKDALAAQITNDPDAPAVRLTDEQIREKYPWDYQKLTEECAKRYSDFKQDKTYHAVRKGLMTDSRFGTIRFLDPGNSKSQKKPFFNPNILNELDKHYTKNAATRRGK